MEKVKGGDYCSALDETDGFYLQDWPYRAMITCAIYSAAYTGKIPSTLEAYTEDKNFLALLKNLKKFFDSLPTSLPVIKVPHLLHDLKEFPYETVYGDDAEKVRKEMEAFIAEIEEMDDGFKFDPDKMVKAIDKDTLLHSIVEMAVDPDMLSEEDRNLLLQKLREKIDKDKDAVD